MTEFIDSTKQKVEKVKKKTVFKKYINDFSEKLEEPLSKPEDFDFVELIRRRDEEYGFDLFAAYRKGNKGKFEFWYLGDAGDEFE